VAKDALREPLEREDSAGQGQGSPQRAQLVFRHDARP
jgi:hypothetical protein